MAQFPDDPGSDFIPGQGSAPTAPPGWPATVPYPGRGTPLEDVPARPPDAQGDTGPNEERVLPGGPGPGTLDMMPSRPIQPQLTGPQIKQIHDEMMNHSFGYSQTKLSPKEEARFQREVQGSAWYSKMVASFGHAPDLNDPSYDYRGAWKDGKVPMVGQQWPMGNDSTGQTYIAPTHPYAPKHFLERATGVDAESMSDGDVRGLLDRSARAEASRNPAGLTQPPGNAPATAADLEARIKPGHALDQRTGRQIPLSPRPEDAVDTRPKSAVGNRISRTRGDDDVPPGGVVAQGGSVGEGGTLEGSQGAEKPDERATRAKARNMVAGPGAPPQKRGYGPGGQYTKEEWDAYGPELEKGAAAPPAQPTAEPPARPAEAPTTVGQSRKNYMQKRLKDIEEGK